MELHPKLRTVLITLFALGALLVILKLFGIVHWGWWIVLGVLVAPIAILAGLVILFYLAWMASGSH